MEGLAYQNFEAEVRDALKQVSGGGGRNKGRGEGPLSLVRQGNLPGGSN